MIAPLLTLALLAAEPSESICWRNVAALERLESAPDATIESHALVLAGMPEREALANLQAHKRGITAAMLAKVCGP